ncbi:MAG: flavin-containing monooxygenase [Nannocystaceae bacterium]|nr:NAD(P)/FAD-dependent oxidoreductase [bacterium]
MKVLVVGAGPSGLAALKEMREAGFDATAVDVRSSIGGVFAADSGVTFDGLHLTISSVFMAFSDFPPPDVDQGAKFWTQHEYYDYLCGYAEHFELWPHIELGTRVDAAHYDHERGRWEVRSTHEDEQRSRWFDKLIVASGASHTPLVPETLRRFEGQLLHSSDYHSEEQVRGKRVLVVGMGEGGADVASSAARTAESVTVWGRRFPDCAPRFIEKFMHDPAYDECEHLGEHHKPSGLLECITISRAVRTLPLGVWSAGLHGLTKDMAARHGPDSMQGVARAMVERAWSADYWSSDTSMVPTKSGVTLTAAARHQLDVVIAPDATVDGGRVRFHDAQIFGRGGDGAAAEPTEVATHDAQFDVIVACTGFGLDFEWITASHAQLTTNPRTWFKHCFPPNFGDCLAFVGFARPHSGGIPACAEMVSRYVAQLYLGNRELPEHYPALARAEGAAEEACFNLTPNYTMLVDYMAYMMSVAKLVGCTPRVRPTSLAKPSDFVKDWTFPLWPCFFRTRGVGANPAAAEAVLSRFGPYDALAPMPLLAIEIAAGFVMPVVNATSLVADTLAPRLTRRALPRLYRWRLSKKHFLYRNSLTLDDLARVPAQWAAASMVLWRVIKRGVAATLGRAGRSTQVASTPRPEPARVASARPAEGTGEGEVPRIRAS